MNDVPAPILVINPNSSVSMTASIDRSIDALRRFTRIPIETMLIADGPPGINTQEDVANAAPALLREARQRAASAIVVACFADPGVHLLREALDIPVLGIAESAYHAAIQLGYRFGVVSISEAAIGRHARHIRELSLIDRLAADRSIGTGTSGLKERETVDRIKIVAEKLKNDDGAEVIILGCAGLGEYSHEIEQHVGLPIVDPVQAAVASAISRVALAYRPA